MRVAVYSTKPWDEEYLTEANSGHDLLFLESKLDLTTVALADGSDAICAFVNDDLGRPVLERLCELGVRTVALRSAGFNHVDIPAAEECGMTVVRVPAYSPHAVAEHTVGLMIALNRRIHRAHNRVRDGDFRLVGLMGVDMVDKVAGIIGTGKIGQITAGILQGFGMEVIAYDPYPTQVVRDMGIEYVDLPELFARSHAISLHCPLTPETYHIIDEAAIAQMELTPMVVNTSRGALIDTVAAIEGLKSGAVGALALDVYEEEGDLFFEDLSDTVIQDDVFARLQTFPNVLVTGHQAFFTQEAVQQIASVTITNLDALERGDSPGTEVTTHLHG